MIGGKKKSHKTVEREIKRYTRGKQISMKRSKKALDMMASVTADWKAATLPPLPPGVIVHPAASPGLPFVMAELPFQCFERHIHNTLQSGLQKSPSQGSSSTPHTRVVTNTSRDEDQDMEQALQAVVPYGKSHVETSNASSKSQDMRLFASPLHRSIVCSIANNFAGMESLPKEKIFEHLRSHTTNEMFRLILSTQNLYTTQALTLNLFNAAIEVGDDRVLDLILSNPQLSMQKNKTFLVNDVTYTPVERAAELGHNAAVRALLKHGADITVTTASHTSGSERHGVLDSLLQAAFRRPRDVDPGLLRLFLNSGAQPNVSTLKTLCKNGIAGNEIIPIIAKYCGPRNWSDWNESGTTLVIFECLGLKTLHQILGLMVQNSVEMNFVVRGVDSTQKPVRIIDAVARRGDLPLLINMCEAGATPTVDTLSFAISCGQEDLIVYVLNHPGRIRGTPCRDLTPLGAAIRMGNENILSRISSDNYLMDVERHLGFQSALQEAAHAGSLAWVEQILQVHDTIDSERLGEALGYAVAGKRRDIAFVLLLAGADANVCTKLPFEWRSAPPLRSALKHGDHELVRALLDADADPNYHTWDTSDDVDRFDELAIGLAVESGDKELIEMLIKAGGDVRNDRPGNCGPPLAIAAAKKDKRTFELLLTYGCAINERNSRVDDETVLSCAIMSDDIDMVKYVLDHGADPHDVNALATARTEGFENAFKLILERHHERYRKGRPWGADILWDAIECNEYSRFQKMLHFGGNPSHHTELPDDIREDIRGIELAFMTPFGLSIAISQEIGLAYAKCMLLNKAKWNCRPETVVSDTTSHGRDNPVSRSTAFLVAIESGYLPIIELLLREGADVNFPAELGVKRTPLQRAAEIGRIGIVQLLLNQGADVNAPAAKRGGGSALQLAAAKGHYPVVRLLVENGADVNADASDVNGRTALEGATEHARLDVLTFLLSAVAATGQAKPEHVARARELAEQSDKPYLVEILDAFIFDGTIRCYSSPPTETDNGLDAAAAQASFRNESVNWRGADGEHVPFDFL